MTRHRTDTDMHEALYKLACDYPEIPSTKVSGIKALAQIMGIPNSSLRNKLSPDIDTHKTSFEEASAIMELCAQAGMEDAYTPLLAMNKRHGFIAHKQTEMDKTSNDCILTGAAEVFQHVGEVAGAVNEALREGEIDPRKLERIESRALRTASKLFGWVARVRGRAKKDAEKRSLLRKVCGSFHTKSKTSDDKVAA